MVDVVLLLEFTALAIISILVISNPLSTSAIFIALTEDMKKDEKIAIARRSIKYSGPILIFFTLTGLLLFELFGFSLGAFRIAGGVLLFTTAVSMMNPKPASKEAQVTSTDISLIPLSIPFTSGPGTIVTVVVLSTEAQNVLRQDLFTGLLLYAGIFLGIIVLLVVVYTMMRNSEKVDALLGEGGRNVVTKIMGLIVMAISVQFVINGIKDILPELVRIALASM